MKLEIKGNEEYLKRMYKHLREEHPSTRRSMSLKNCKPKRRLSIPRGFR